MVASCSVQVHAQENEVLEEGGSTEGQVEQIQADPVLIANTRISFPKLVGREGNKLVVNFLLSNDFDKPQGDIRYALSLKQAFENRDDVIFDIFVPENVDELEVGEKKDTTLVYDVPEIFEGTYTLQLSAGTGNGITLATVPVDEVTFTRKDTFALYIETESCYLSIGDTAEDRYDLYRGYDFSPDENVEVVCQTEANEGSDVQYTPRFETRERVPMGDIVDSGEGEKVSVSESGSITIPLRMPERPQAYDASIVLIDDEGNQSNEINLHYVVQGESATAGVIHLDKTEYDSGDVARVTMNIIGQADQYLGSRAEKKDIGGEVFKYSLNIVDGNGVLCGSLENQMYDASDVVSTIEIPIETECRNPEVRFAVMNDSGEELDSYSMNLSSEEEEEPVQLPEQIDNKNMVIAGFLAIASILLLFVAFLLLRKKKNNDTLEGQDDETHNQGGSDGTAPYVALLILFASVTGVFFPVSFVTAETYETWSAWNLMSGTSNRMEINIGDVCVGEIPRASGSIRINYCDNNAAHVDVGGGGGFPDLTDEKYCAENHGSHANANCSTNFAKDRSSAPSLGNKSATFQGHWWEINESWGWNTLEYNHYGNLTVSYRVLSCLDINPSAVVGPGCARTGDSTRNVSVAASMTVVSGSPDSFQISCNGINWVSGMSTTCVYDSPSASPSDTKIISFRAREGTNAWHTETVAVYIPPCPCNAPTIDLTVNGVHGTAGGVNTNVNQDESFDVSWSFSNPGETYACTFTPPSVSTLATDTAHSRSVMDSINYPGPAPGTLFPYRFTCNGPDVCADVTRRVNVSVTPAPFTVNITTNPASPIEVVDMIRWFATPDGGVPPYGPYSWSGAVTGSGTNSASPVGNYVDRRYGVLGTQTARVTVRDSWNQTAEDELTVTIQDSRTPQ